MAKPIIAANLDGFLIRHDAFIRPHIAWFDRIIALTGNSGLAKWKGSKDYFLGVDEAMAAVMPHGTKEERTQKARSWYQEDVILYIRAHPDAVYPAAAERLRQLGKKYRLALITTNTKEHIDGILEASGLERLFDIVFASSAKEKPDKSGLFKRFEKEYGKPKYYIAGRSKEAFEECIGLGWTSIYVTWDGYSKEIESLATKIISDPKEMN